MHDYADPYGRGTSLRWSSPTLPVTTIVIPGHHRWQNFSAARRRATRRGADFDIVGVESARHLRQPDLRW